LGLNLGPDIAQAMNVVHDALGTVQQVTYQVGQAEEAFLSRYQQVFNLTGIPQGMFGQSASQLYLDMRRDISAAMQESVRIRSIVTEAQRLQGVVESVAGLASLASPGILQAQQAGNSLVQATNSRLANIQSELISYHESQVRVQQEGILESMIADVVHAHNMACFGQGRSNIIVDPYGLASSIRSSQ
jgi:conjugal transfer/entry exclusion protein